MSLEKLCENVYASTPFKFVVGGNAYYIHSDLVASRSAPLGRMINGGMAEAQQGFAVLDDVDEETIQRFIEWAYKGYYTAGQFNQVHQRAPEHVPTKGGKVPKSRVRSINSASSASSQVLEEEPPHLTWDPDRLLWEPDNDLSSPWPRDPFSTQRKSKKAKERSGQSWNTIDVDMDQATKARRDFKESFLKYDYKVRRNTIPLPPTRGNLGPSEDYTDVFLSHARLYVFAEMYDIQTLKMLALEELHSTLANYTLYDSRVGDILALLRYVYANTSGEEGGNSGGGGQELRKLLKEYVGCEMGILIKSKSYKDSICEDGGDFLRDFMEMVALRID